MAVQYKKLFHLMIEKNVSATTLKKQAGISSNIMARLKKNEYISLSSIESICRVMKCSVDEMLEFVPDAWERNDKGNSND